MNASTLVALAAGLLFTVNSSEGLEPAQAYPGIVADPIRGLQVASGTHRTDQLPQVPEATPSASRPRTSMARAGVWATGELGLQTASLLTRTPRVPETPKKPQTPQLVPEVRHEDSGRRAAMVRAGTWATGELGLQRSSLLSRTAGAPQTQSKPQLSEVVPQVLQNSGSTHCKGAKC